MEPIAELKVSPARRPAPLAMDDRLLRLAGLALPAAVWVLGLLAPPRAGLTPEYVAGLTTLLVALVVVDLTAPRASTPLWRRLAWLLAELALCWLVVRQHGTLVRPTLIYLLPASRALLLFGARLGVVASLLVWVAFALNILADVWPDRLHEYPNYLTALLAPYVLAVALTLFAIRQASDRQRVQELYDELSAAHRELQALHQQTRELAVTQERNRLAREIHDGLAHYLTVISVQLEAAEKLRGAQAERALEQVRRARRLTIECLREVRRSVASLRAASLEELSLPRSLEKLAAEFSEATGMPVALRIEGTDIHRLPADVSLAVYRAAQEGLTNVQRHAEAHSASLNLSIRGGHVSLELQDDGRGPMVAQTNGSGFGLLGLTERVELLGGHLEFGAGPRGGCRLVVSVPFEDSRS